MIFGLVVTLFIALWMAISLQSDDHVVLVSTPNKKGKTAPQLQILEEKLTLNFLNENLSNWKEYKVENSKKIKSKIINEVYGISGYFGIGL